MRFSRRELFAYSAFGAATAVTGACSSGPTPRGSSALDQVTFVTAFGTFGREAFAWVADAMGYFKDAGLKVSIVPGAAGDQNLNKLAAKKADFIEIDYSGALVRAGNGSFGPFRCVAALETKTLIGIMTLDGYGITTPADLEGKTVAQAAGAVNKTLFPAYAKLAKFNPAKVTWVDATPTELPTLLGARRVDAIGQFVMGVPTVAASSGGRKVTVFPYSQFMTDLYGNAVVTRKDILDTKRSLVTRFTGALLKGLDYAVNHPTEAGEIMTKANPTISAGITAAEMMLLAPYVASPQSKPGLGPFDQVRVARGIAVLQSENLIPSGLSPEQAVDFNAVPASI